MSEKILPCPFCGGKPTFPEAKDVYGSCYDVSGCCDIITGPSYQICDYMTIEERTDPKCWDDNNLQYDHKYINRVKDRILEMWNTRKDIF